VDRTERFYKIERLLRSRRVVPIEDLLAELEISRATFKRDLEYLRDRFGSPIVWDAEARGYRFESDQDDSRSALPGFWLSGNELQALLAVEHLIETMEPGVLSASLAPLKQRLEKLLAQGGTSAKQIRQRVRLLQMGARAVSPPQFSTVAAALLGRRQIQIVYFVRERAERTERAVSPQRLVYYRDNWYLDAWCHLRKGLRSFALDAIESTTPLAERAKEVDDVDLDKVLGAGYGIFSGEATHKAKLRFSAQRARWVSKERWHPQQVSSVDGQGRYVLEFPYSDPRELLMDILRHGAEVEVLAPATLRKAAAEQLKKALQQYD
jgi:predicted DNA-binding transcriptional regulator YafY